MGRPLNEALYVIICFMVGRKHLRHKEERGSRGKKEQTSHLAETEARNQPSGHIVTMY